MIETSMVRVTWHDKPVLEDVTVLICQNKTYDLIRLTIESLLTFYPTIKIVVADNSPNDRSGQWLRYKSTKHTNLQVVSGDKSHGVAMHTAIIRDVETKYVLLLDSDVIFKRHGVIELMHSNMINHPFLNDKEIIASGSLMNVTNSNDACGPPKDESDILRYIHPSVGMYNVEMYKQYNANFVDHGAPCVYVMQEARRKQHEVVGVNVADYVLHLSGASWTDPRTVWEWDFDTFRRPLLTIVSNEAVIQSDDDYEIVSRGYMSKGHYVIHGRESQHVDNNYFNMRFNVRGDYVCLTHNVPVEFVKMVRNQAIRYPGTDILDVAGVHVYSRRYFQSTTALL